MSLSVGDALRDGLRLTFEREGLTLIGAFLVVRFASAVATNTLNRANLALARELGAVPGDGMGVLPGPDAATPLALGLGVTGAFLLFLAVAVVAEAARIVAVRTFVSDPSGGSRGRNLATATVNGFVGGIVVLVLVLVGLLLLVVPGVFLAISFFFVRQEIAVRDVTFVEAMGGSWELTAGRRLEVFGLALALFVLGVLAALPTVLLGAASPELGTLVGALVRGAFVVFAVASVTRAYVQLREAAEAAEENEGPAGPSYEGALSADDLPPPDAEG